MIKKILIVTSVISINLVLVSLGINLFTGKQVFNPINEIRNLKDIVIPSVAAGTINSASLYQGSCNNYNNFTPSTNFKIVEPYYQFHNLLAEGSSSYNFQQFIDINGDGLLDYVRKQMYTSANSDAELNIYGGVSGICVLLNNGKNFETAYQCASYNNNVLNKTMYIGDCAQ